MEPVTKLVACADIFGELNVDGFDENERQVAELAEWRSLHEVPDLDIYGSHDFKLEIARATARGHGL